MGINFEVHEDELHELLDFLEIMADLVEINNVIDESPSEFTEDQYNYLKTKHSSTFLLFSPNPPVEFPDPDDIQEWLSNQDNSEDKED